MRKDLFDTLDRDWAVFESSCSGSRALARWRDDERELAGYASLRQLMDALGDRLNPERQDALMLALLRLAGADEHARRVVLRAVTPALVRLSRGYRRTLGGDDAASVVVLAAMERMAKYSPSRGGRPAANLIQDVRYTAYRAAQRESALRPGQPVPVSLDDAHDVAEPVSQTTATDDLVTLLAEAINQGSLTAEGGRVIFLTRVADVPTSELAAADGVRPSSIRKRRERAEAALGDFAVEVA